MPRILSPVVRTPHGRRRAGPFSGVRPLPGAKLFHFPDFPEDVR